MKHVVDVYSPMTRRPRDQRAQLHVQARGSRIQMYDRQDRPLRINCADARLKFTLNISVEPVCVSTTTSHCTTQYNDRVFQHVSCKNASVSPGSLSLVAHILGERTGGGRISHLRDTYTVFIPQTGNTAVVRLGHFASPQ